MSGILPFWLAAGICIVCCVLGCLVLFCLILMDLEGGREAMVALIVLVAIGYFFGVQPMQAKNASHDQRIAQLLSVAFPGMKAIHVKSEGREASYHIRSSPGFVCYAEVNIAHGRPAIVVIRGGSNCEKNLTNTPVTT